jgi:hypothetical protein
VFRVGGLDVEVDPLRPDVLEDEPAIVDNDPRLVNEFEPSKRYADNPQSLSRP